MEYCHGEVFNASCGPGRTVVVTSAMYGRMGIGRCIPTNDGHLGCHVDVTHIMNSRCSGQQFCEIVIPDEQWDRDMCRPDAVKFLAASFNCEPPFETRKSNYITSYHFGTNGDFIINVKFDHLYCYDAIIHCDFYINILEMVILIATLLYDKVHTTSYIYWWRFSISLVGDNANIGRPEAGFDCFWYDPVTSFTIVTSSDVFTLHENRFAKYENRNNLNNFVKNSTEIL